MAITLTSYPVTTESGKFSNVFAGFKPIELGFSASASEVSIECVLVDPDNDAIDLLGFSLYSDFDVNGNTVIDVSVINDLSIQSILFESQEIADSRIKYRVKYREAGTTDPYVLIASPTLPIISVYSITDFDLDKWLTPEIEPVFWIGYPLNAGFIHSDANESGLDIVTKYDLLDIQKSIISSDIDLFDFGADGYGVLLAKLSDVSLIAPVTRAVIANGGGVSATDWINPVSGVAQNWDSSFIFSTHSIVTGNGFTGNAQRTDSINSGGTGASGGGVYQLNSFSFSLVNITISFKYRFSKVNAATRLTCQNLTDGQTLLNTTVEAATATIITNDIILTATPVFLNFEMRDSPSVGDFFEIDEINFTTAGAGITTEYIDFKIISE